MAWLHALCLFAPLTIPESRQCLCSVQSLHTPPMQRPVTHSRLLEHAALNSFCTLQPAAVPFCAQYTPGLQCASASQVHAPPLHTSDRQCFEAVQLPPAAALTTHWPALQVATLMQSPSALQPQKPSGTPVAL